MIRTNLTFLNDLEDVVRLFYPEYRREDATAFSCFATVEGNRLTAEAGTGAQTVRAEFDLVTSPEVVRERQIKRYAKVALYRALKADTGRVLPWGSLTGIRPTRIASLLKSERVDVYEEFTQILDVKKEYADLTVKTLAAQEGYRSTGDRDAALYIHIPVCPSRCYYCSFVSVLKDKCNCLDEYASALKIDCERTCDLLDAKGYRVTSVYVGGGTPTVLTPRQMETVLSGIRPYGVEFTVEAGRPDTITAEKLDVMKAHGVTRVSVNPQTFCDDTLRRIGRNHTASDIERAYGLTVSRGFDVNMDLIMGLDGETAEDTCRSVRRAIELSPDNITLHTLCKKRGSDVHVKDLEFRRFESDAENMLTSAQEALDAVGYVPYYLYRQKNMLDGLHNVGYCKVGKQCVNNIDTMEEGVTVAACGSGGISKRLFGEQTRIERFALVKPIELYLARFEEMMDKKRAFFE